MLTGKNVTCPEESVTLHYRIIPTAASISENTDCTKTDDIKNEQMLSQ